MELSTKLRVSFVSISVLFFSFGLVKILALTKIIQTNPILHFFEICTFTAFVIVVYWIIKQYVESLRKSFGNNRYSEKLTKALIRISRNSMFFAGDINKGAKVITKEIAESLEVDTCSIWLYDQTKESLICEQLYLAESSKWNTDLELNRAEFADYFSALSENSIIIANDAGTNQATQCFKQSYLKPFHIKSMLHAPIVYRGEVIGVICIDSVQLREWVDAEINFAQTVSSLYSLEYSVSETISISKDLTELEKFIDMAALVSKTDQTGKVTYVNRRFEQVSGWKRKDALGQDSSIISSSVYQPSFWKSINRTVVRNRGVWNDIVTCSTKNGRPYHVDTYIKGIFDQETGEFKGFMSISHDVTDVFNALTEVDKKNTYLEHAAKILRHDMNSGINIYIPRGISSLERRLTPEVIKEARLEAPLKMLKEGLAHTQRIYKGVYEFTNLVKSNSVLEKKPCKLDKILDEYLKSTSYRDQVILSEYLPIIKVNESLFCTAIDNLIRNGLRYNDSETKVVAVYLEDDRTLAVQDNGRGMSQEDLKKLSKPYARKGGQKESGTGLGLNICIAILNEHGFKVSCEIVPDGGTKIKIRIK